MERSAPAFTLLGSEIWQSNPDANYDIALTAGLKFEQERGVMRMLEVQAAPVISVAKSGAEARQIKAEFPKSLVVLEHEGWLDCMVMLGSEVLRCVEAQGRARKAEQELKAHNAHAVLGRYMLDTRHGFNNALTSVLGNAELLMMEPIPFSAALREQIDTIHSMALRMHEMMQRFTSLEAEMSFAEKEPVNGLRRAQSQAYASGS
jgi:signal transduction histidine kinase